MKKVRYAPILLMIVCMSLFTLTGCLNTTPQERVETLKGWIDTGKNVSTTLETQLVQADQVIKDAQEKLADPAINFEQKEKIQKALVKAQEVQQVIAEKRVAVDTDLARWNTMLETALAGGEIDISTEFKQYGQITSDVGKYMPAPVNYVFLGLGALITSIGGWLALKKKKTETVNLTQENTILKDVSSDLQQQITDLRTTVKDIVQSEDKLLIELEKVDPVARERAVKTLDAARDSATRAVVNDVQNGFEP